MIIWIYLFCGVTSLIVIIAGIYVYVSAPKDEKKEIEQNSTTSELEKASSDKIEKS